MNVDNLIKVGKFNDKAILTLKNCIWKYKITNPLCLAHFLSQVVYESDKFRIVEENLKYSAKRLVEVFPKYFDAQTSINYQFKPQLIANKVYSKRMGNGSVSSNEGYLYRGRGYIQITGKNNYMNFGKFIGANLKDYPDLVATDYPLDSAYWFFQINNLWKLCILGSDENAVKLVTLQVNGGTNGIDERQKLFKLYWNALNVK